MALLAILAATLLSVRNGGIDFSADSETKAIDPGRSVFLALTLRTARGVKAEMPDIRERCRGFSVAEEFPEDPEEGRDGSVTQVVNWKLVPVIL